MPENLPSGKKNDPVPITVLRDNIKHYISLINQQSIYISSNKKIVAKLVKPDFDENNNTNSRTKKMNSILGLYSKEAAKKDAK